MRENERKKEEGGRGREGEGKARNMQMRDNQGAAS